MRTGTRGENKVNENTLEKTKIEKERNDKKLEE